MDDRNCPPPEQCDCCEANASYIITIEEDTPDGPLTSFRQRIEGGQVIDETPNADDLLEE